MLEESPVFVTKLIVRPNAVKGPDGEGSSRHRVVLFGFEPGGSYSFSVRAVGPAGIGPTSRLSPEVTLPEPPRWSAERTGSNIVLEAYDRCARRKGMGLNPEIKAVLASEPVYFGSVVWSVRCVDRGAKGLGRCGVAICRPQSMAVNSPKIGGAIFLDFTTGKIRDGPSIAAAASPERMRRSRPSKQHEEEQIGAGLSQWFPGSGASSSSLAVLPGMVVQVKALVDSQGVVTCSFRIVGKDGKPAFWTTVRTSWTAPVSLAFLAVDSGCCASVVGAHFDDPFAEEGGNEGDAAEHLSRTRIRVAGSSPAMTANDDGRLNKSYV
jgi:hypothetical protein